MFIFVFASIMMHCTAAMPDDIAVEMTGAQRMSVRSGLLGRDNAMQQPSPHTQGMRNEPKRLTARLLADAGIIEHKNLTTDNQLRGVDIRRLQFDFTASWRQTLRHKLQVDIAGGDVRLLDVYLEYGPGPAFITVGQLRPMSSPTALFTEGLMERAAITEAFGSGRQTGIGLSYKKPRWTFFAGGFKGAVTSRHTDMGRTYSSRLTAVPILREGLTIHIGGKLRHRKWVGDAPLFQYRGRSILDLGEWQVATDHFADEDMFFGLELAALVRSFSMESECMLLRASTVMAQGFDRSFGGCYLLGSWFLSGESRRYDKGAFLDYDATDSVFKHGAWQVVVRYDEIDLNDEVFMTGEQKTWTLGLNWYISKYVRLAANFNQANIQGGPHAGTTTNALGVRFGIIW